MIRIQTHDFDVGLETQRMTEAQTAIGGLCTFLGLVRDFTGDKNLERLTLEHYPEMTEKQLENIEQEARRRWDLEEVLIIHRFGDLAVGDKIVFVATAAAHRKDAFESCQFLMDWLKTKAPFWKKEICENEEHWVEAKAQDDDQAHRWDILK